MPITKIRAGQPGLYTVKVTSVKENLPDGYNERLCDIIDSVHDRIVIL